ncbi:outer membrane protein OmpA-like peptidoglycan-associated protein [Dyella sp. SG562]|uniref:eCIS core domain-containing protein n=1 Tax=Dyella sp. SG562 TaxID=2587017 RepID=UPI0014206452|nr:DUF4157 domain-containing protein [Dyella sp. SG562]NII75713.1 outer membrane protein OmpA-like peptidoglycan-associated protein [Dyella sp. SG562]
MNRPLANAKLAPAPSAAVASPVLRRKCACGSHAAGGECESCKQRVHRKERAGASAQQAAVPGIVHDVLGTPGRPLDAAARAWMEPRFGHDFSGVRVHTDGQAAASARSVGARAYAVGQHLVFDHRQYAPHTPDGRHLLAHELAHTIQDAGGGGLHPKLQLGAADDASERAADRAADAVAQGRRAYVAPAAGGVIRRQIAECYASAGKDDMQKVVRCPDMSETEVTMVDSTDKPEPKTTISAVPGYDSQNVFVDITYCRGKTSVTISPSASLPATVAQAIGNVLSGKDPVKSGRLTAGLGIEVAVSDKVTVTIGPTITAGVSGKPTYGGGVQVKTPYGGFGAQGQYDAEQKQGGISFSYTPGDKPKNVDCHTVRHYVTLACAKVTRKPADPGQPELKGPDTQVRRVYFDYAKDTIRQDFHLPDDIETLAAKGYRVTAVQGFTSPEGPRGREHEPSFIGNDRLSVKRAEAALRWLQDPKVCPHCDTSGVKADGQSELPPLQGKQKPEPVGRPMEEDAVKEYLGEKPGSTADPTAPKAGPERDAFKAQPFKAQRDQAFDFMRRADITLVGSKVTQEFKPAKPEEVTRDPVACDEKVINAARKAFGIAPSTVVETTKP